MILVDTSIWIHVFRDKTRQYTQCLYEYIGEQAVVLTRFQQLELLQGCRDESEWNLLSQYLEGQDYIETQISTWQAAASMKCHFLLYWANPPQPIVQFFVF